jgi:GNAT superfamily N-acetyltransferase
MEIEIREVSTATELKSFIDFPHSLYKGDKYYVPELFLAQKEIHNESKNPYFKHAKAIRYLAYSNSRIVGRIAAHVDHNYNEYHQSNVGLFGFYDVEDNIEISKALFEKAKEWLRHENVDRILGPFCYSLSTDTGGLLVDAFDSSPLVMMTYNFPYYVNHVEACGFVKEMDLFAYMIYTRKASEKSVKLEKLLSERLVRNGITIRSLNKKNYTEEINKAKEIYIQAWEKNWGFVPPTDEEFQHLADALKLLLDEDFAFLAEHNGKPVGFFVSLPNINEITINFNKGRLFPFNVFKLLFNKKKVKRVRIALLGVLEEYRNRGIEAVFYAKNINEAKRRKLIGGEASWILENNEEMVKGAEKLNGEKYKTYRIYGQNL